MSKQNKIIWRTLVVLVIAFLISLCFLGSTFARYTSTASGTGGVAVSSWDVAGDPTIVYDSSTKITPLKYAYDATGATYTTTSGTAGSSYQGSDNNYYVYGARVNTSEYIPSLTVINSGDVDAQLDPSTLNKGEVTFYSDSSTEIDFDNSTTLAQTSGYNSLVTYARCSRMLEYKLYFLVAYNDMTDDQKSAGYDQDGSSGNYYVLLSEATTDQLLVDAKSGNVSGTLQIYARVTWTSNTCNSSDGSDVVYGSNADIIDTWIGLNVDHVEFTVSMTAYQASQHPTT